jgi:hypothetical protein
MKFSVIGLHMDGLWARSITDRYAKYAAAGACILMLAYYLRRLGFSAVEIVLFSAGSILLWLPLGGTIFALLRSEVPDPIVRFTISAIASYSLTTLAYFAFSVLKMPIFFYLVLGAALAFGAVKLFRKRLGTWPLGFPDASSWVLPIIISGSLIVTIPYKKLFDTPYDPITNETFHTYRLAADHILHASIAYELDRNTPNRQSPFWAGLPDRAYHNFPHITTMLLARFTQQRDMLRAHIVYHYTIIECLFCLALFSLAKVLTGSRIAGYIGAATLYIFLIRTPPLLAKFTHFNPPGRFFVYFTLFPDASSGMELVEITSSQMYSGVLVLQGILLSIVCISVNMARGQACHILLGLAALLIASTIRFRGQIFIVVMPSFLLIMLYATCWKRSAQYALAAALALLVAAPLFLEMRSATYLPTSSALRIGFNDLAMPDSGLFFNNWPFAYIIMRWVRSALSNDYLFGGVWQLISMLAFTILNIVGILLTIFVFIFLWSRRAWSEFRLFSVVLLLAFVFTIFEAVLLAADYDSYSLGGQVPLHIRWYFLGLGATAFWIIICRAQEALKWSRETWGMIGLVIGGVLLFGRYLTLPSKALPGPSMIIDQEHWLALEYLHDRTPPDAVIIMREIFPLSGLYGRAAYYEYIGGDVFERLVLPLSGGNNRPFILDRLWSSQSNEDFCALLAATRSDYLLSDSKNPLQVEDPQCLVRVWLSPRKQVEIFKRVR